MSGGGRGKVAREQRHREKSGIKVKKHFTSHVFSVTSDFLTLIAFEPILRMRREELACELL